MKTIKIKHKKMSTITKCILTALLTLLCCIDDVTCYAYDVAHTESREQCVARNKSNNKKLKDAGYYVSPETKAAQKKDCASKKTESRK